MVPGLPFLLWLYPAGHAILHRLVCVAAQRRHCCCYEIAVSCRLWQAIPHL